MHGAVCVRDGVFVRREIVSARLAGPPRQRILSGFQDVACQVRFGAHGRVTLRNVCGGGRFSAIVDEGG